MGLHSRENGIKKPVINRDNGRLVCCKDRGFRPVLLHNRARYLGALNTLDYLYTIRMFA